MFPLAATDCFVSIREIHSTDASTVFHPERLHGSGDGDYEVSQLASHIGSEGVRLALGEFQL